MPMLLKSEDGPEFELALIEDRFPDPQDGFGDAGWLTLSFRVATDEAEWEETAPLVNTFEVKNLVEWIEGVLRKRPDVGELDLLEPELRFSVVEDAGDRLTLRVGFHLPDRPSELAFDPPTDEAEHVDLRLTRDNLRIALNEFKEDIERMSLAGRNDGEAEEEPGLVRPADEDLDLIDQIEDHPPGAGAGEDNAGHR